MRRVEVLTQSDRIGLTEPRLSIGFADYKADNFDTVRCRCNFLGIDFDDIIVGETETNRYSEYFPVSLQHLYGSINPECS